MQADKKQLEGIAGFIREHRSNEAHFNKLYDKLISESESNDRENAYKQELLDLQEKASAYQAIKNTGGSSWPEFEKFVTGFEKAVMAAIGE